MQNGYSDAEKKMLLVIDEIAAARRDLGEDLMGSSPVDLIADKHPSWPLNFVREAVTFAESIKNGG